MAEAEGLRLERDFIEAGFSLDEIQTWKNTETENLRQAGFSREEIDGYFGVKNPDFSGMGDTFKSNFLKNLANELAPSVSSELPVPEGEPQDLQPEVREAETFLEAVEAGFDMSVSGLLDERPDVVLPQNAPMYHRIASQVATLAGDFPTMVAGGILGGAGGGALGTATLPVVGTVGGVGVGAAAGAFALPEAMRSWLIDSYENGDVESFEDFWSRASGTFIEGLKGGVLGAVTAGTGGLVAKVVGKTAAPVAVKTTAQLTSEVATMASVGAAMQGRVPEPQEFLDAAVLVGGLKASGLVVRKSMHLYKKYGITPKELADKAVNNPKLKQQLLAENVNLPEGVTTIASEFGAIEVPKVPARFRVSKLKESKPVVSENVSNVLASVGEKAKKPKQKLSASEMYKDFVDGLDPINEAVKVLNKNKVNLPADKNPYMLGRMAVDAKAKAKHFFEKGTLDFNTLEVKSKSLKSTLESVENPDVLNAYLISKRALEKNKQKFKTGVDIKAAKKVVAENKAYAKAAKEVVDFQNNVLEYAVQSGILDKKAAANMKAMNADYIPFKRIMEQTDKFEAGKLKGKLGSFKRYRGSERQIQNPIEAIVENTAEILQRAEINRASKELVKFAEGVKDQKIFTRVKDPLRRIQVNAKEIAKATGLSEAEVNTISIFRTQKKVLAPNQFEVMIDGKRRVYETTPQIAEAVKSLGGNKGSLNPFLRMMRGITAFKKFGITFTPDFILRNAFRDSVTASVFSKSKAISPLDLFGAMGDLFKRNETYYNWLKSGGANGAFLELNQKYIARDIYKLNNKTSFMGAVRNLVTKPIDMMRISAELIEQAPRMAEFKKVTKGRKDAASLMEGGYASREITIDFQRMGAKTAALNSITAFQNVSIQGLDRTARAIKQDPKGVLVKSAAYITTPSLLLWWANKDDSRYQETPQWEKDLFWIIPTDNWQPATQAELKDIGSYPDDLKRQVNGAWQINKGNVYRIPKPMELGIVFGSLPERIMDLYVKDNPSALQDFEETIADAITPALIPDAISPALEQFFNKSFFTGNDIVPYYLKDIFPEYQFTEYTSETAKTLGKMIATIDKESQMASPTVLDNYIRSWGGSLGQYALQVSDKLLKKAGVAPDIPEPEDTLADVPFVKAFAVRYPRQGTKSIRNFYDLNRENEMHVKTIRHLIKGQDLENAKKEVFLAQNQGKIVTLAGIKKALSVSASVIRNINKDPNMSPDEKRQLIDGKYFFMIKMAKQGAKVLREFREQADEQGLLKGE